MSDPSASMIIVAHRDRPARIGIEHRTGTKIFHHPVVGRLELDYEALVLPADPGLQLNVYTTVAGSPSHDGLRLLASWAATRARETAGEPNPASTFPRSGDV